MAEVIEYDQMPMNSLQRCDRDRAQAYVQIEWADGRELLLCAHHGDEHMEAILRQMEGKQVLISDHRPYLKAEAEAAKKLAGTDRR